MEFRDIIKMWPSVATLARDAGTNYDVARKWVKHNRIPAEYWAAIIKAAQNRGYPVTCLDMVKMAAKVPPS